MASPITFSGFNQIDFNVILNAVMEQESQPLRALQSQQKTLEATSTNYGQLASKLDALETATEALARSSTLVKFSATSSDAASVGVSASTTAISGSYTIVVNELAQAQTTVSTSSSPDTNTTIVADAGALTINGVAITISGPVTLDQLAAAINAETNSPASASIVQTAPGQFRLVLTAKDSGTANAFTLQNTLTAPPLPQGALAFGDDDNDGTSGDSTLDNAVQALDAQLTINGISVTSSSNTVATGIPGLTLTLLQKNKTATVTIARDDANLAERVDSFVTAYNDLVKFAEEQTLAARNGKTGTLANDAVLKSVRYALRGALSGAHGAGTFKNLSEVGLGFTRTGQLKLDKTALTAALTTDASAVHTLFAAAGTGAFVDIDTLLSDYTNSGGFIPSAKTRISSELSRLGRRMDDITARLVTRRASLQKEYIAADLAMARLNAQKSALASFGANFSNF